MFNEGMVFEKYFFTQIIKTLYNWSTPTIAEDRFSKLVVRLSIEKCTAGNINFEKVIKTFVQMNKLYN